MASSNPSGNGNSYYSRGGYNGHRTRPHTQNRVNRRSDFSEDHSASRHSDRQLVQETGDASYSEGSNSTNLPQSRRGRGYGGPPRNVFKRKPQNQFASDDSRQSYTRNDDGNHAQSYPSHNSSRNFTQTQEGNFYRGPQTYVEYGAGDSEANFQQQFFQTNSNVPNHSNDTNFQNRETKYSVQQDRPDSLAAGESSTRPKQSRGSSRPKFKNAEFRRSGQNYHSEMPSSSSYENTLHRSNVLPSDTNLAVGTVEHQPYDNIEKEYSQYRNHLTFSNSRHESRGNRSSQSKYRKDDKGAGRSTQERFPRSEGNGHDYRDGQTLEDNGRDRDRRMGASAGSRNQSTFNKSRTHEHRSWRGETHRKDLDAQKPTVDTATQRERLTTQLTSGTYECMVCCESVKPAQPIWNCSQCFHAFHLGCVRRWSRTSQDESGQWRCPGCQSINKNLPSSYFCYCLKQKDPEWNRRETPHSCGEVCGKALGDGENCIHTCTLLCHPGPCPICSAQTQRKCPCGKSSQLVKCGSTDALLCGEPCKKQLSCGLHECQEACHVGPCETCPVIIQQICFCGQSTRELPCSTDYSEDEKFSCDHQCHKTLSCGKHQCEKICHSDSCGQCQLEITAVTTCPCGKVELMELYKKKGISERKSCTDPIPICGKTCGKILSCGPAENPHTCAVPCHAGLCPPCPMSTILRCRCTRNEKKIPCRNLKDLGEVLCERRCNKKRQCGRHKCAQVCCIDKEHICPMVCGRTLSCGLDRCEALCHAGNCNRCFRVSFDELRCHCGTQVIYPPVPCGTRPPDCDKPCTRVRPCGHPPSHNCHPDATGCPPCTTLCEKFCYGKHEKRKNIPCHLTEVSCGKPCGRPMKCGKHTCPINCHAGPCPASCTQPCPVQRSECDHPCALPCHEGPCPGTPCREKVKVQCQCGQRTATVSCEENELSYRKMATGLLATKMAQLQSGECVDLKDLLGKSAVNKTKSLECNEECALVERNRRLALALQIKNPNPKPGAPPYPDLLKEWAKKDQRFVQMVHDRLTELVQLAKQSVGKMKSRSHSFESMNRDKRQFIHEYCVFFGCESMSYDEEPKRNVVATAFGELSFLPAVSILDVARREMGQRKMPAPPRGTGFTVLTSGQSQPQTPQPIQPSQQQQPNAWGVKSAAPFRTLSDVVKSNPTALKNVQETPPPAKTSEPKPPLVDYFDFTSS